MKTNKNFTQYVPHMILGGASNLSLSTPNALICEVVSLH